MRNKVDVCVTIQRHGNPKVLNLFMRCYDDEIHSVHSTISEKNPYCFVNFVWGKGKNIIYGVPFQLAMDQNSLTLEELIEKWYTV